MAIKDVETKCYILALFIRNDGARFLLGSGAYEFKEGQQHFAANTMANDVVEVQGNDGYLLAGQVRRPGVQSFDGYVGDSSTGKPIVESLRRDFFQFFRKGYFYKVVYVFPDGSAIQRKRGFLVDAPVVQELYQIYPEYHVALNFEDINYYFYDENDEGEEIYGKSAIVGLSMATGGLIWDEDGAVTDPLVFSGVVTVMGADTIDNLLSLPVPLASVGLYGDTFQQTYSGKNLYQSIGITTQSGGLVSSLQTDGKLNITGTATSNSSNFAGTMTTSLPAGTYTLSMTKTMPFRVLLRASNNQNIGIIESGNTSATFTTTTTLTSLWIWGYNLTSGTTYNETVGFQLEVGSTSTSFEPYVGGIPSPNPDYPQEVQTVAGKQTVAVMGKNLAKPYQTSGTISKNGVTLTMNADGSITLNGTSTGNSWLQFIGAFTDNPAQSYAPVVPLSSDKTYTFSYSVKGGTISGEGYLLMQYDDPDKNPRETSLTLAQSGRSSSFTGKTGIYRMWVRTYSGAVYDNFVVRPQVEVGSTATTYEPYQGQSYTVDLRGTNLLDLDSFVIGGMSSGVPSPTTKYRINNADKPIKVEPDTAYTISAQLVSPVQGFRVGIHECQADGTFIQDLGWKQLATAATTFTTGSTTGLVKIVGSLSTTSTNVSTGNTENTTACDTVDEFMRGCTLMLEEGSSATTYQPYNPIELCRIGDYQDYVYKSGDDWYVHKETNSTTYSGSEVSLESHNYTNIKFGKVPKRADSDAYGAYGQKQMFCTHADATGGSGTWDSSANIGKIRSGAETSDYWIGFPVGTTLATMQSGLDGMELYYILATPTDTQITDTSLIAQLEALGSAKLFVGENNLLVTATGTNLPAVLEVGYYTEIEDGYGFVWEEGRSPSNIIAVDSIDDVFPVLTITGETQNPILTNVTTGTIFQYNGTITASQTLVVDMMNQTATLNGTSVIGNVTGDWVYFAPGNNRVSYTATNANAPDATIEWQEIVG